MKQNKETILKNTEYWCMDGFWESIIQHRRGHSLMLHSRSSCGSLRMAVRWSFNSKQWSWQATVVIQVWFDTSQPFRLTGQISAFQVDCLFTLLQKKWLHMIKID